MKTLEKQLLLWYKRGQQQAKIRTKTLSILAILTTYNEEDIIEYTVSRLLKDHIDVHVIDNWSTDNTYRLLKRMTEKNTHLSLERFPLNGSADTFDSESLLNRIETFGRESNSDWIIHIDADEVRESCWFNISYRKGIQIVNALGFNAINHTVIDFRPTKDGFDRNKNPEIFFNFFDISSHPSDYFQIKTWKNQGNKPVLLSRKGGHEVDFKNRRIFPLNFLIKHYSLRSKKQIKEKMMNRIRRINKSELRKGWHTHYFNLGKMKVEKLIPWDKEYLYQWNQNSKKEHIVEFATNKRFPKNPKIIPYVETIQSLNFELSTIKSSSFYKLWRLYNYAKCLLFKKLSQKKVEI